MSPVGYVQATSSWVTLDLLICLSEEYCEESAPPRYWRHVLNGRCFVERCCALSRAAPATTTAPATMRTCCLCMCVTVPFQRIGRLYGGTFFVLRDVQAMGFCRVRVEDGPWSLVVIEPAYEAASVANLSRIA